MLSKSLAFGTLATLILSLTVNAADQGKCATELGTCDQFSNCCNGLSGYCGRGYNFCGSGCFEAGNFKNIKCMPKPPCKSGVYKFDPKRIISSKDYNGDYMKYDFTIDGDYEMNGDEIIIKYSTKGTGNTLHSTRYINFGKISADVRTARGGGIVSSFITMADNKDEIDFEWLGNKLEETQTNWFYRGIIPENGKGQGKSDKSPNTFEKHHRYTLDFTNDKITWQIDGKTFRESARSGKEFPETPTRYSFGLWDAGEGAEGTREWAGGHVDYNAPDFKAQGYFAIRVKNVEVTCYGEPTSKDEDFEVDQKLGLVLKGSIKKSSKDRDGGVLGNETMFDSNDDQQGNSTTGKGQRNIIKSDRTSSAYTYTINFALIAVLPFIISLFH